MKIKTILKKIFSNLTREELEMIIGGEGLQRTLSSIQSHQKGWTYLKQYMADTGFSGVISTKRWKACAYMQIRKYPFFNNAF